MFCFLYRFCLVVLSGVLADDHGEQKDCLNVTGVVGTWFWIYLSMEKK